VVITPEGIDFLKRTPPPIQENLIQGLQDMSQEDIEKILWSIDTIVDLLHERNGHGSGVAHMSVVAEESSTSS
jgi:hypothetical protein